MKKPISNDYNINNTLHFQHICCAPGTFLIIYLSSELSDSKPQLHIGKLEKLYQGPSFTAPIK